MANGKQVTLIKRSQPFCGGCNIMKTQLDVEGIDYDEIDITEQPEAIEQYSLTSVPTLLIGDEKLSGVQPIEKVKELIG